MDEWALCWVASMVLEMHSRRASVVMLMEDDAPLSLLLFRLARQVWYVVEDMIYNLLWCATI